MLGRKLPLSKQLTLGAVVGGTAFLVSATLSAITAGVPADRQTTPTWFIGLIFGSVAGAVYLMLSGNRSVPLADDAARTAALAGPADPAGAQLLVMRQGFVGKLAGVDVSVDGRVATQLKSPRFAALAVTPGRHELVAAVQNRRSEPLAVEVAAGETAVVRLTVGLGKLELVREPDLATARRALATVPMVTA